MAATITIEIDDAGRSTVTIDGQEAHQCETVDECLQYLEGVLKGEEPAQEAGEAPPMPEGDMAEMWSDEAAKRPKNPNLMM